MSFWSANGLTDADADALPAYELTRYTAPLSPEIAARLCLFLRTHFGNPPHTPLLCLSPTDLLLADDLLWVASQKTDPSEWIGTIRYRYVGTVANHRRYVVDAFCVHPSHRSTGVGRALLHRLRQDANQRGIPYAFFLKEGRSLPRWIPPFFTGSYVYQKTDEVRSSSAAHTTLLPTSLAHRLLALYAQIHPRVFILFPGHTRNQLWMQYKQGYHQILVCVQNTFQITAEGQRMGWVTAWLESACISSEHRSLAAREIISLLSSQYDLVWFNKAWVGDGGWGNHWKEDGAFHWYTFQWSVPTEQIPGQACGHSYCLLH